MSLHAVWNWSVYSRISHFLKKNPICFLPFVCWQGTNPYCTVIPRHGKPPLVLDFATSEVALGKVRVALNQEEQMASGMLIDARGIVSTDLAPTDFVPARSSIRCNAMLLQPTFHYALTCAVPLAVSAGSSPQRDPHNRSSDHVSRTVWRNSTVWPPQGCRFSCCV